jgi:hypothetical protein
VTGTLKKYGGLTRLVYTHGRWKHSGENFNQNRKLGLKGLGDFIPAGAKGLSEISTSFLWKNAVTRNLLAQLAFIKSSWKKSSGHLTTNGVSYIRIPKSGSTSASMMMLQKKYPAISQTITEAQINFLADVNTEGAINDPAVFFTIVRNPFSRLVSVYRDFIEKMPGSVYRDYLFGILPAGISFSEFVERIASIPEGLMDPHIRPQHRFLRYYEEKKIEVQVFNLEEPEKLDNFLRPFAMQLPHLNKSAAYDYRSYYSTQTLGQVREIYGHDISRFGYQKALEGLENHIKTVQK